MSKWSEIYKDYGACSEPIGDVKINGRSWKSKRVLVTDINVNTSVFGEAGTCSVQLAVIGEIFKSEKVQFDSDFSGIKAGASLEVSLGYKVGSRSNTKTVFVGYISSVEYEFLESKIIATIQGMDAKIWMMSGRKTEMKKTSNSYSDAVLNMYTNYANKFSGKEIKVDGEPNFKIPIYQRNESDYEFVCRVANMVGALFFVDGGKFYFINPSHKKITNFNIDFPCLGIVSIRSSVSVWGVPKSVEVSGINPKDYTKNLTGQATTPDAVGEGKTASNLTKNISSSSNVLKIVDNTVSSVNEAKFLAKAKLNMRCLNVSETYIETMGNPNVRLASGLEISGMGNPVDNNYIVTAIEHNLHGKTYTTQLQVSANRFQPKDSLSINKDSLSINIYKNFYQ